MSTATLPEVDREFYTVNELMHRWKVGRTTVYREVKRQRLNITRIGGAVRFAAAEVVRYESQY